MSQIKHENNGACRKCLEIIFKYPDPYEPLIEWFVETQKQLPEMHCSEAGREECRQTRLFEAKPQRTKAKWKESAHNWGAALDLFVLQYDERGKVLPIYDEAWFRTKFVKFLEPWLEWYGRVGAKFYELPHVEVKDWERLAQSGDLKLVQHHVEQKVG